MRFWFVLLLAVSTVSLAPKTDNDPFDYSSFKTYYELNDSVQSNLKGKTVLIQFWATWCLPCRVKNGELNQTYSEFGNDHFEIISVALDTDSAAWKKAIKKDGFTWKNQIVDQNKFVMLSSIARKYGVTAIPAKFLISPKGKLMGKLSFKEIDNLLVKE